MPRILITGSRNWTDTKTVFSEISRYITQTCPMLVDGDGHDVSDVVIVHGACPTGADWLAAEYAEVNFIRAEPHPAKWSTYGRAAGPLRNQEMVDLGADVCLAFIRPESRGTIDCAKRAEAAGIETRRFFG